MQTNGVQIENTPNIIVITDSDANQITVTQPITSVIEVSAVGPQGPKGLPGDSIFTLVSASTYATTSSLIVTGSFTVSGSSTFTNIGPAIFSGSVTSTQGFTGSLFGTSSYAITASYALNVPTTASYALQALSSSYAVTASYALNGGTGGGFYIATGSVSASVSLGTGSFTVISGSSTLLFINNSGSIGISTSTPFSTIPNVGSGSVDLGNPNGNVTVGGFAVLGKTSTNGYGAVGSNYYLDNANALRRRNNDFTSVIGFDAGGFNFGSAGGGAVGSSISLSTLAVLNNSGNLTIGNGTTTLSARVGIKGSGTTSSTTSLLVQNSAGTELLKIDDGLNAYIANQSLASVYIGNTGGYGGITVNSVSGTIVSTAANAQNFSVFTGAQYVTLMRLSGGGGLSQVSIGTSSPSVSSKFQIDSTTQGFLLPRTNLTSNISTPAQGLQTYITSSTTEGIWYYNSGLYQGWTRVLNDSGSQSITGSLTLTSALTASSALINGNVVIKGTASVDVLVTNYQSSSIIYSSGSTLFGDTLDDNHWFTGSLYVTASTVSLQGGSFSGSGANLFNIPASGITGLNLSQIATGSVSASVSTGTGSFTVTSGSSNFLFVSSSGNVGIGTTTPTAPLHVVFNPSVSAGINIDATLNTTKHISFMRNGVSYGEFGVNASSGEFRWTSPGGSYFPTIYSNGAEAMRIDTNQNVGIGTASPSGRLHIKGSGTTSSTTAFQVQNANASSSLAVLDNGKVGVGTTTPAYQLSVAAPNAGDGITAYVGSSGMIMTGNAGFGNPGITSTNGYIHVNATLNGTGGSEVLNVNKSANGAYIQAWRSFASSILTLVAGDGSIGIKTSAPSASLHVVGNTILSGSAGTGSALLVYKSGSTVLDVQGSSGQLFSVTDSLTGSLFSVNTVAGLPVIEAFSDNTVNIGKYGTYPIKVAATGTLAIITGSFSGSLTGIANTASFALTASYVNPLVQNVLVTGSVYVSQSVYGGDKTLLGSNVNNGYLAFTQNGSNEIASAQYLYITRTGGSGWLQIRSWNYVDIDSSLGVGLNSQTPSARLHVKGSGATSSTTALLVENTNATASLSVLDNGRVGIGTSSPTTPLTINKPGSNNYFNFEPSNTGTAPYLQAFYQGAVDARIYFDNAFQFRSAGSTIPYPIDAGAIQGTSLVSAGSAGSQGSLSLIGSSGNTSAVYFWESGVSYRGALGFSGSSADFQIITNLPSPTSFSGNERLRIFGATGNVAIGTSTDSGFKIDISGSGRFSSNLTVTGSVIIDGGLFDTTSTGSLATGSTLIYSVNTGSYTAGFFDYYAVSGSNGRAGTIMSFWLGGQVQYTDNSTPDVGNTSNIAFSMSLSASSAQLFASASSAGWNVKTSFRTI